MIYLNHNSVKTKRALQVYYDQMFIEIFNRYEKLGNNVHKRLFEMFVLPNLEKIIKGLPNELILISNMINSYNNTNLNQAIELVFKYKGWFDRKVVKRFDAYDLAEMLDVSSCTYCNGNYTHTIITINGKKIIRPQFDHYFNQKEHPILALSFYNLIPSCSTCNSSIKHGLTFDLVTHTNPYLDNSINNISFSYKFNNKSRRGLEIVVNTLVGSRENRTVEDLKLKEIYSAFSDEVLDLIKLRGMYSDRYLVILEKQILKGVITSQKELYRLAFGTYFSEEDFVKRPLSKLKKDILKELNIIE